MASERQTAANRQNARKSTGPKTATGKRHASRNAYRYGLSIDGNAGANSDPVESLARHIAGKTNDQDILYHARIAARAHLDLARIRHVKLDIIERVQQFGGLELVPVFRSIAAEIRYLKSQPLDQTLRWPDRVDPLGPMPVQGPQRTAEGIRRLLQELRKLHRYEDRAFRMSDGALQERSLRLMEIKNSS
jgi:hypothetical protein